MEPSRINCFYTPIQRRIFFYCFSNCWLRCLLFVISFQCSIPLVFSLTKPYSRVFGPDLSPHVSLLRQHPHSLYPESSTRDFPKSFLQTAYRTSIKTSSLSNAQSSRNLVTVHSSFIQEAPGEQPQCHHVLSQVKSKPRAWNSPTVRAFRVIYTAMQENVSSRNQDIDKSIHHALHVIRSHCRGSCLPSVSWPHLLSLLGNCVVGKAKRTLFMEFVARGLALTLEHPLALNIFSRRPLIELRDAYGNNLLHLSVLSGNLNIVHRILGLVQLQHEGAIEKLLTATNHAGHCPRDLAIHGRHTDIVLTFQAYHAVYTALRRVSPTGESVILQPPDEQRFSQKPIFAAAPKSCAQTLQSLRRTPVLWNSPTVAAFRIITLGVTNGLAKDVNVDKTIVKALTVISGHFARPAPVPSVKNILSFFNGCIVDKDNRTFLMLFIMLGLTETLSTPLAFTLNGNTPLSDLYDAHNNNVLHFAVLSKNVYVVNAIIGEVQKTASNRAFLVTKERLQNDTATNSCALLRLLESENVNHETPRALAVRLDRPDIVATVQAHYTVYHALQQYPYDDAWSIVSAYPQSIAQSVSEKSSLRPLCEPILRGLQQSALITWNSPAVTAFLAMGLVVTNRSNNLHDNADKVVINALSVLSAHFTRPSGNGFSGTIFIQLTGCSWTEEGHTLFMRFVRLGLTDTLRTPTALMLRGRSRLDALIDNNGSNLIHLSVLSNNVDVVAQVLQLLQGAEANIFTLLQQRNADGLTPKDLAVAHHRGDIVNILHAHYSTYSTLASTP